MVMMNSQRILSEVVSMRWPTTAAPAAPAAPASVRLERLDDEGYVSFVATARAAAADELL